MIRAESFTPRGIGNNWVQCLICQDGMVSPVPTDNDKKFFESAFAKERGIKLETGAVKPGYYLKSDLAGFVPDLTTGRAIQGMFEEFDREVYFDLTRRDEERFQIKIGACKTHQPALELMYSMVSGACVITPRVIRDTLHMGVRIDKEARERI